MKRRTGRVEPLPGDVHTEHTLTSNPRLHAHQRMMAMEGQEPNRCRGEGRGGTNEEGRGGEGGSYPQAVNFTLAMVQEKIRCPFSVEALSLCGCTDKMAGVGTARPFHNLLLTSVIWYATYLPPRHGRGGVWRGGGQPHMQLAPFWLRSHATAAELRFGILLGMIHCNGVCVHDREGPYVS